MAGDPSAWLRTGPGSGGDLIDVGANAGYFSLLWAALNPGNRVDAFEALPANVDRLRDNTERNKLGDRIHLHPFALGAADGAIAFETGHAEQSGWGGIARRKIGHHHRSAHAPS
jgi:FkbM family methyltransferase